MACHKDKRKSPFLWVRQISKHRWTDILSLQLSRLHPLFQWICFGTGFWNLSYCNSPEKSLPHLLNFVQCSFYLENMCTWAFVHGEWNASTPQKCNSTTHQHTWFRQHSTWKTVWATITRIVAQTIQWCRTSTRYVIAILGVLKLRFSD